MIIIFSIATATAAAAAVAAAAVVAATTAIVVVILVVYFPWWFGQFSPDQFLGQVRVGPVCKDGSVFNILSDLFMIRV